MTYAEKLAIFDEIRVKPTSFNGKSVRGIISIRHGTSTGSFELIYSYAEKVDVDRNMAGLLMAMPAINFTLFSKKLVLDFPVSDTDMEYLGRFVAINNKEVFVNKIARRRYEFFRKEFLPDESDITEENSLGITEMERTSEFHEREGMVSTDNGRVSVLSSGGKESLLSYGILKEAGAETHAFYFNESGSHWFTASTAYKYFSTNFRNVHKVWSNVDRLYRFFLRNLPVLDQDAIKRKADTYPVQLFIFPVYITALLPLAMERGITSVVLGDEFDDPREVTDYKGIRHYYGVFDQTHDFNSMMSDYLSAKTGYFRVWSAVYPVSGSVVEKMLISRYGELFSLQRSCHSCRSREGEMVPCGRCSKCLGIEMFTLAAGGDPGAINYSRESVENLEAMVASERMRLDSDELNLMKIKLGFSMADASLLKHVEGVHVLPDEDMPFEKVPVEFRDRISDLISVYAKGIYRLVDNQWNLVVPDQKNSDSVPTISS